MSDFTEQQRLAIEGRGNVLVVAGAGTGKTHTLIERCLRLVMEEKVSLENILMVTFTDAAAAEMRARLREGLLKLQAAAPEDERLAEQLALLETARISTLHGFCLLLAREHFHQLDLDPQFAILDEQQTKPLQAETLDALLERHYLGSDEASLAVQRLIRTVGRGQDASIRHLVQKLHAYTHSLPDPKGWLAAQATRFAEPAPTEWRELLQEAVAEWRDGWRAKIEPFQGAAPGVEVCLNLLKRLEKSYSPTEAAEVLRAAVEARSADINWPRGTVGKVRKNFDGFFDEAEFLAALMPGADGTDPLAQDWEWARQQMLPLVSLTREFSADYAARKQDLGGVDFSDLEQLALRALALPGVAEAWRARLQYLFVDEYQDINAAQDAILGALSRSGTTANRFLVGDVKQSIYRFRLANPKIFQGYHKAWSGSSGVGKTLSLTENFRSREGLLAFINPLFGSLMREETGGVVYEGLDFGAPEARTALAAGEPVVELHVIARADAADTAEDAETADTPPTPGAEVDLLAAEREARLVAQRLRALHDAKHQVWDKDAKVFREVKWSDMAVLMRSPGGRAEMFAKEFSQARVPLIAARDGFFACLEISDLLSLLKLLDNPLQDVPLVAVLRSPLVGLTVEELAELRAAGSKKSLFWEILENIQHSTFNVQPPIKKKVAEFTDQYHRWREMARQTSLAQTLETVLNETHFEEMLLAGERGTERTANVRRLLDMARQFDPYQRQGLYRFLRFVQQQEDEEIDREPAPSAAENAVRLISIHKSKGLEFPVVAVAGLGTLFNEQDASAQVLLNETLGLCPKVTPPDAEESYESIAHWVARRELKRESRGEELRLLYVAVTRARDHLILVGTTPRKAEKVRWESTAEVPSHETVLKARSHLDWLLTWLPTATQDGDWVDDRTGGNEKLTWSICDATDAVFKDIGQVETDGENTKTQAWPPVAVLKDLQSRLDWKYPFRAATTETAKATVSALRRRAADEAVEETKRLFESAEYAGRNTKSQGTAKLTAAARGTAHHIFLQYLTIASVESDLDLHNAATRMLAEDVLTPEEVASLDFPGLRTFLESEYGQSLRAIPERLVHRELQFTARMSPAELRDAGLPRALAKLDDEEFFVVQGTADLVVIQEKEIWLLDFKTDAVTADEVAARAKSYESQLKLYALALSRIYGRKVTDCRLWFLSAGVGVKI